MHSSKDQNNIDLFFMNPAFNPGPQKKSSLYILRLDMMNCIEPKDTNPKKVMWGCSAIILSGIDLLGQYYAGDDSNLTKGVGRRFTDFCKKYIVKDDPDKADILYQFRNAFLHNYGLLSFSLDDGSIAYQFEVDYLVNEDWFILHDPKPDIQNYYKVNLDNLYIRFNAAIEEYKADVEENKTFLDNFNRILKIYRFIGEPESETSTSTNSGSALTNATIK